VKEEVDGAGTLDVLGCCRSIRSVIKKKNNGYNEFLKSTISITNGF